MAFERWQVAVALAGLVVPAACADDTSSSSGDGSSSGATVGGDDDDDDDDSVDSTGGGTQSGGTTGDDDDDDETADFTGGSTDDGTTGDDDDDDSTGDDDDDDDDTTGDNGTTDDGGTTEGEESSGGEGETETGEVETGGIVEGDCDEPLAYPYAGALCDPVGNGCDLLVEATVDPTPGFRNAPPAVTHDAACQPLVLYSLAEGGFTGTLAHRVPGDTWDTWAPDVPVAVGGLGYDATTGEVHLFMDDGAFGMHHAVWDGDLSASDTNPGMYSFRAQGVSDRFDGVIAVGASPAGGQVSLNLYDDGWDTTLLETGSRPATATAPNGDVHVTFWDGTDGGWILYWRNPESMLTEVVTPLGSALLDQFHMMAASEDGLHIVYANTGGTEIRYAEYDGEEWATEMVTSNAGAPEIQCPFDPIDEFDTCDYDYTRLQSMGIVASAGGDVRMLIRRTRFVGSLEAECFMGGPGGCFWNTVSTADEHVIEIIDPTGPEPVIQELIEEAFLLGMDTSLDAQGNIHVAAYEQQGDGSTVEYWLIGAVR